jgi:hypothetical protein
MHRIDIDHAQRRLSLGPPSSVSTNKRRLLTGRTEANPMLEKTVLAAAAEWSADEPTYRHPPNIAWLARSEPTALGTLRSRVSGLLVLKGSVNPFRPTLSGLAMVSTDSPLSIPASAAGGPVTESKAARMH